MVEKQAHPKRFEVYWVNMDPTIGGEVKKTRPCVIISPDSMNAGLNTVIIAPMTSTQKNWPFRVAVLYNKQKGYVMLDQIRTVSKLRLHKVDGTITGKVKRDVLACLEDMFAL